MNKIKFPQQKRNRAFIEDLDMLLYRVYNDGSYETIKVPFVKDGLKRIPFIMPEIVLVKFSVPQINGYKISLIEKSKDNEKAKLVYVVR